MSQEQITLFDSDTLTLKPKFLHVIRNGESVDMDVPELFDSKAYQELRAVAFVASPRFFFNVARDFSRVSLILGIEDGDVSSGFAERLEALLNVEERINFWNMLDDDVRQKVIEDRFSIRYPRPGTSIHSKIYLLKGEDSTRVIVGSANFTENAFQSRRQYEELLVYDDPQTYDVFAKRFQELEALTVDYIPENFKRKDPHNQVFVADPETVADLIASETTKVITYLSADQMEEISLLPDMRKRTLDSANRLKDTVEILTKPDRKGNARVLPLQDVKTKDVALKRLVSRYSPKSAELDVRRVLTYNAPDHLLYTHMEGTESSTMSAFPTRLATEDVKYRIQLINDFVGAYSQFTAQEEKSSQGRVFETILYAFMAPFIWKMRDHYALKEGRDSVRRHFPPLLVMAGRAMSGKTTALEFVGMLLGQPEPYISYEAVKGKNVIADYFRSSNVSPVLVDELDPKFFQSKADDKGERLIKFVANEGKGPHPVLVATTNATGFDVSGQLSSRIYYLQFSNTFDKHNVRAETYLQRVMQQVDDRLFRDFLFRVAERLKQGFEFYTPTDPLNAAREIFKVYYQECGLPVPEWFPNEPFHDYEERGELIWKNLFRSERHLFNVREDNTIYIDMDKLSSQIRDRTTKINFLPPQCIQEDSTILVVDKAMFFDFIGHKEAKPTLLSRLFRRNSGARIRGGS